jgi:hypothetical protein
MTQRGRGYLNNEILVIIHGDWDGVDVEFQRSLVKDSLEGYMHGQRHGSLSRSSIPRVSPIRLIQKAPVERCLNCLLGSIMCIERRELEDTSKDCR